MRAEFIDPEKIRRKARTNGLDYNVVMIEGEELHRLTDETGKTYTRTKAEIYNFLQEIPRHVKVTFKKSDKHLFTKPKGKNR